MKKYIDEIKSTIIENTAFLVVFFVFITSFSTLYFWLGKKDAFILLHNLPASTPLDYFFKYFTDFGHGITFIIIAISAGVIMKKRWMFVYGIISFAFSGLMAQLLKRTLFHKAPRPHLIINENNIRTVLDVHHKTINSFPSGHTTTAFAMCFFLASISKNNFQKAALCIVAFLIGYSRIYLGQHFVEDVIAGSILGVTTTLLITPIFKRKIE